MPLAAPAQRQGEFSRILFQQNSSYDGIDTYSSCHVNNSVHSNNGSGNQEIYFDSGTLRTYHNR